jgi:acetyl-CoA carboxylase biotin carboxyl carrier protein
MDLKKLEKVMELMHRHGVNEVEVDDKSMKLKVVLASGQVATMPAVAKGVNIAPNSVAQATAPAAPTAPAARAEGKEIRSPFVGTFYESATPGADPFVQVGKKINKGDILCIIEAMKLMNEIEAEESGTIVEILGKNGEPVQFDQPLFIIA